MLGPPSAAAVAAAEEEAGEFFFCCCSGVLVLQHLEQEFRVPEDCCTLLTHIGSSGALKRVDRCSIRHCLRESGVR